MNTIAVARRALLVMSLSIVGLSAGAWAEAAPKPDKQMKAVLDELGKLNGKPIETLKAKEARQQPTPADAVMKVLQKQGKPTDPEAVGKVADLQIDGAEGKIPARVYTPKGTGPFPLIVYFHGGGWVIATIDTYDASARALANGAEAVLLSVEYRKAPENKFPAAHNDAFAAYQWALAHAQELNADPTRIAVAGESAGGNLAANVSIMARDKGIQMPVHQLLVYPVAGSDMETESYKVNANAQPLNKAGMKWFVEQTFTSPEEAKDPRISLVSANLAGLPSTTLITDEIDPLRSEGMMLTEKLKAAKVEVDHKDYTGVTHEFFGMGAAVDKAKDAEKYASSRLKKAFKKAPSQARNPARRR